MAKRPIFPGALGRLNATRYEMAKDGKIDLDSVTKKNESEKSTRIDKDSNK